MQLNDACLLVLGYKPEQIRFAMTHTQVHEGVLWPRVSSFNFDRPACYRKVVKALGLRRIDGASVLMLDGAVAYVKAPTKEHAAAVCAAVKVANGQVPSRFLVARVSYKLIHLP
jgi:hypothetical protein